MFELRLLSGDDGTSVCGIGAEPTYIGRAPGNHVIVTEQTVSSRHVAVWAAGDRVFVEDLHSRNGTFVDDRRIQGTQEVSEGQIVRLGAATLLKVVLVLDAAPLLRSLLLEDELAGLRYPLRSDRALIGSDPKALLRLDEGPAEAGMLLLWPNGSVELGIDDDTTQIEIGVPFEVGGRTLVIRAIDGNLSRTHEVATTDYAYGLSATLDGAKGPEAVVEDLGSGRRHTVTAGNRAVLLFLLAQRAQHDAEERLDPARLGWVHDEELVKGIWGRTSASGQLNNLNVLLCRVRAELRKAGFDPWFVERDNRFLRVRVRSAEVS